MAWLPEEKRFMERKERDNKIDGVRGGHRVY